MGRSGRFQGLHSWSSASQTIGRQFLSRGYDQGAIRGRGQGIARRPAAAGQRFLHGNPLGRQFEKEAHVRALHSGIQVGSGARCWTASRASRAEAFLSNDYYESDIAWMDLDAPLDITIGPYETYTDELFGYKAAFEAYVNLRDDKETAKLAAFAQHLQEIENNLPEDPKYRVAKLGAAAPIRVVDEILSSGDGSHGVQTAAYNLPNDERVVQQKGSKRVMLKNIQEAKFH